MKCRECGEEFPNLNALTKHKEECTGIFGGSAKEPDINEPKTEEQEQEQAEPIIPIIPISLCPEELKYLALGVTVGVKVEGTYTPDGILIREVKLIR